MADSQKCVASTVPILDEEAFIRYTALGRYAIKPQWTASQKPNRRSNIINISFYSRALLRVDQSNNCQSHFYLLSLSLSHTHTHIPLITYSLSLCLSVCLSLSLSLSNPLLHFVYVLCQIRTLLEPSYQGGRTEQEEAYLGTSSPPICPRKNETQLLHVYLVCAFSSDFTMMKLYLYHYGYRHYHRSVYSFFNPHSLPSGSYGACHPSYTDKILLRLTVWVLNGH